jgi:hypothetical protein
MKAYAQMEWAFCLSPLTPYYEKSGHNQGHGHVLMKHSPNQFKGEGG